ncbi:MAG: DNA mismatch repair endonuclease MutL [Lachnospiraceae bacterium]|nr:DNA mismatch repair endonuclease MutL [Lachnospiraceae bacterium]
MAGYIHVLDSETIDKIAAGEVVEKPASVVKELVENSIDAGADKITVEIREGGISFIRVTDNGCGIDKEDLENAFMRHATSKIVSVSDLNSIVSLGFRGEALSSISAVAQVEMITKRRENLMGVKVCCNGGVMEEPEEIGAPDGTTIIVRNLFYNTPVRKKFLRTSMTEGSYVAELMQHIAMSHPNVSISYIQNGQNRFFTSGNGDLSEIIYRIYGRDISDNMISVDVEKNGIHISGFVGKPVLARANRNYETFFVNGRYIKSKIISLAVEEGYKSFLMQHKYPFAVLHFRVSGEDIDVNVHPTKMEIRIMNPQPFCELVKQTVAESLSERVLIPEYAEDQLMEKAAGKKQPEENKELPPEPFETKRHEQMEEEQVGNKALSQASYLDRESANPVSSAVHEEIPRGFKIIGNPPPKRTPSYRSRENLIRQDEVVVSKAAQMEMFTEGLEQFDENRLSGMQIIGQVFKTYWIVEFEGNIYFVDQHAAHEKVNYENWMKKLETKKNTTQMLMPPMIISLSPREMTVFRQFEDYFVGLGFELETFGGDEIALRGIPQDLYGADEKQLFLEVLDELAESPVRGTPEVITSKLASMSCKAAVKGNQNLSFEEAKELLKQLFVLENPYHCPHGRPTMFSMSKYEMEKKFKRIV